MLLTALRVRFRFQPFHFRPSANKFLACFISLIWSRWTKARGSAFVDIFAVFDISVGGGMLILELWPACVEYTFQTSYGSTTTAFESTLCVLRCEEVSEMNMTPTEVKCCERRIEHRFVRERLHLCSRLGWRWVSLDKKRKYREIRALFKTFFFLFFQNSIISGRRSRAGSVCTGENENDVEHPIVKWQRMDSEFEMSRQRVFLVGFFLLLFLLLL